MERTIERRLVAGPVSRVTVQRAAGGKRAIVGYAAVYYDPDDPGTEYYLGSGVVERIMPGAFDRALREKQDARALFNHDSSHLLGRVSAGTLRLESDRKGLRYRITEDPNDPDHQSVIAKIERGDLTGSSFSFYIRAVSWTAEAAADVRQIEDLDLVEVSPVTFPAYESTTAGLQRGAGRRRPAAKGKAVDSLEAERIEVDLRLARVLAEN